MGVFLSILASGLRPGGNSCNEAGEGDVYNADETDNGETYAISKFRTVPLLFSMKPTRTSLSARARRASLSYFSYATGTSSMNSERRMLVTDTKMANPDKPAAGG